MSGVSPDAIALPLPWQNGQWQRLQRQRERDQLPHALLLAGPPSVGKRRFARALAKALLCHQPGADGLACGACRSCTLLAAGTHPDWAWVAPEEAGKAIKIDQVRAVVDSVAQTAQQGGRKLVVIEPAEALNRNAANALLKTLEEPSGSAVLLLVTDAPGRLLPTIRSRCQRLDFPLPPEAATRAWLEPLAVDAERLERALTESGHRPLFARALLDNDGINQRQELAQALVAVLEGRASAVALADQWQQQDWETLLEWLQGRVAQALRSALGGAAQPRDPLLDVLKSGSPQALFGVLDRIQSLLAQSRGGGNPNRQLALENLLFHLCERVRGKSAAGAW